MSDGDYGPSAEESNTFIRVTRILVAGRCGFWGLTYGNWEYLGVFAVLFSFRVKE